MSSPVPNAEVASASAQNTSNPTGANQSRKDNVIAKNKERSERVKIVKAQEELEKERRLADLKAAEERDASRRAAAAELRKKRLEDLKLKEEERQKAVEERRRQMAQHEKEKNEAILNRFKEFTEERGARNRDKPAYAFGSSTPRTLTYQDSRRDGPAKLIQGVHPAGTGRGGHEGAGARAASMTSLARRNISASPSPEVYSPNHRGANKAGSVGPGSRAARRPVRDSMTTSVFGSLGSGSASSARPPRTVRDKSGLPPGLANASMTASYSAAEHVRNVRQPKPPVPRFARKPAQSKPLIDKTDKNGSASPAARKPPPVPRPHRPTPGAAMLEHPDAQLNRTKKPQQPSNVSSGKPAAHAHPKPAPGAVRKPASTSASRSKPPPGASKTRTDTFKSVASSSSVANSVDMGIDGEGGATPDSSLVPSPTPSPTSPSLPETADKEMTDQNESASSGVPASALVVTTALTNDSPVSSNESMTSPRTLRQSLPMSDDSLVTVVDARIGESTDTVLDQVDLLKGDQRQQLEPQMQPTVVVEESQEAPVDGWQGKEFDDGAEAAQDLTPVQQINRDAGAKLDGGSSNEDFRTYTPTPTGKTGPVMTEEEAKASLAENRRLAREKLDREKELERLRLEKEQAEEDARIQAEEEAFRAAVEEERRMADELKQLEEERLQAAIQLAEQERVARELEQEELRKQKEEEERRSKEETERLEKEKAEREERLQREEAERTERKKKLDAIMARTRKTPNAAESGGTNPAGATEQSLTAVSASSSGDNILSNGFGSGGDTLPEAVNAEPGLVANEISLKLADGDYKSSDAVPEPSGAMPADGTDQHQQRISNSSSGDSSGDKPKPTGMDLSLSLNENNLINGSSAAPSSGTRKSVQDILSRVRSKGKLGQPVDGSGATTAANLQNDISSPDGIKGAGIPNIMTQSMYVSPTHQQNGEMLGNGLARVPDLMTQSVYNPSTLFDADTDGNSVNMISPDDDFPSLESGNGLRGNPAADYFPTGTGAHVMNGYKSRSNYSDVPAGDSNIGINHTNGISPPFVSIHDHDNQMNVCSDDNDNPTQYDVSLHESQSESQMARVDRNLQSVGLGLLGHVPPFRQRGLLNPTSNLSGGYDDLNASVMSMNVQFDENSIDNRRDESFARDLNSVDQELQQQAQYQNRISESDPEYLANDSGNEVLGGFEDLDSETPNFLIAKSNSPEEAIAAANAALSDPNANEVLTAARQYWTDLHRDNSPNVNGGDSDFMSSSLRSSVNGVGGCGASLPTQDQVELSMIESEGSSSFYTTCQSGGDIENNLLNATMKSGSSDESPNAAPLMSTPMQSGGAKLDLNLGGRPLFSDASRESRMSDD